MTSFFSDDVRLIYLVAEHDSGALQQIYVRFSRPVFALALRIARSRTAAEDILQNVFCEVWNRASDYRANLGSPFSWIIAITRHRSIDQLRAEMRHLRHAANFQALGGSTELHFVKSDHPFLTREREAEIHAAVNGLAPLERQAIEMSYFGGLTSHEIADELGLPLGTVKARVRRGLLHLRRPLKEVDPVRSTADRVS